MTESTEFDVIDRQIADLQHRLDGCRQTMLLSRVAILGAVVTLIAALLPVYALRTPTIVLSAVAILLGGLVWLGASKSSAQECQDELTALETAKNRMIDKIAVANGWRDLTPTVH